MTWSSRSKAQEYVKGSLVGTSTFAFGRFAAAALVFAASLQLAQASGCVRP
ncbi:MAG: hypothetical protein ABI783_05455 [Actinomycetota bacterium]